jgi:alpha-L-fucosidase
MDRRTFLLSGSGLAAGTFFGGRTPADAGLPGSGRSLQGSAGSAGSPGSSDSADSAGTSGSSGVGLSHRLPLSDGHYLRTCGYAEDLPVAEYTWAPDGRYEDLSDMKFGIRVHWGLYSILQLQNESWPFLMMSKEERASYQHLYQSWFPQGFDADEWTGLFKESGARMFSFTAKHHDGFSMYDTSTRVSKRVNWLAPGGPVIEHCDHSYSIMDTPFRRDVVRELCTSARQKGLKIDLYFSHPDWYDADFRPYTYHPLQVPGAAELSVTGKDRIPVLEHPEKRFGKSGLVVVPDPDPATVQRMMARHRAQLEELITRYGTIDMVCLDMFLGPSVWPALRETMMYLRKLRPDVMYRARGIGNYGDYYTPEGFVPGSRENTDVPWFVIYPLGGGFSYEPRSEQYKGVKWIIDNLIDCAAKGGNFMVGIGPDGNGRFHTEAVRQLRQTGEWLASNGAAIYATRARDGELWREGGHVRFTRSKDRRTEYAFLLEWPGEELVLRSIKPRKHSTMSLLGYDGGLQWKYDSSRGVVISLPPAIREKLTATAQLAYVIKIDVYAD